MIKTTKNIPLKGKQGSLTTDAGLFKNTLALLRGAFVD